MSADSQAQIVTEDSGHGQIIDAVRHNSQMVMEAQIVESVSEGEQRIAQAEIVEDGGLAGRASAVGGSLGAQGTAEFQVYSSMAIDGLAGGVGQMVSTAADFLKGMKNPHAYGGMTTMDDYIAGRGGKGAAKREGSGRSIRTEHFNDLAGRQQGVSDFVSSGVKGVTSTPETVATFSKKRELACSAKMLSQLHLGNAKAAEAKVGAKVARAAQLGMGNLVHAAYSGGPKGYVDQTIESKDTSEDWASA